MFKVDTELLEERRFILKAHSHRVRVIIAIGLLSRRRGKERGDDGKNTSRRTSRGSIVRGGHHATVHIHGRRSCIILGRVKLADIIRRNVGRRCIIKTMVGIVHALTRRRVSAVVPWIVEAYEKKE